MSKQGRYFCAAVIKHRLGKVVKSAENKSSSL